MDFRSTLDKLDRVMISEAITLQDVEAAVKGKERDEQGRAEILNNLAWDNKLPGLYDPVSGYFVAKQSQPSMGGRYNISATASSGADKALADMGLVPQNAKTSTGLGRMFRGDDRGQYDQDIRTRSQGVVSQQKYDQFKTTNIPKLKELVTQLKAAVEKMKAPGTFMGLDASRFRRESKIYESLLQEFEDELIDGDLGEQQAITVPPGMEELARIVNNPTDPNFAQNVAKFLDKMSKGTTTDAGGGQSANTGAAVPEDIKKIIDQMNDILLQFDGMSDQLKRDPETQKELNAIRPEIANAVRAVADKAKADADAKAKPATAQAPAAAPAQKLPVDANKSKEERMARMKELLAKAKQPKTQSTTDQSGTSTNTGAQSKVINTESDFEESITPESMSQLMARIQRIAEGTTLNEELTADEYKELQTIAAGLKTEFPDDAEIQTISNQALGLPAVWSSDKKDPSTSTDKKDPSTSTDKKDNQPVRGQKDPRVLKIQEQLIALGIPLPKFGADGKLGSETENAIKAFQKMAGVKEDGQITPELEKLLADGKNVIARSKLVQSITAVEQILVKYKISESVTLDDLEIMNEDELRLFVMKNIGYLSDAEQMSVMKALLEENSLLVEAFKLQGEDWKVISRRPDTPGTPNPGELILQKIDKTTGKPGGKLFTSTSLMQLFKNDPATQTKLKDLETNVLKQAARKGPRFNIPITGSERDPIPKGSFNNLVATEKDLQVIRNKQADIDARNKGTSVDRNRSSGGTPGGTPGTAPGGEESTFKKTVKGIFNKMTGSTRGRVAAAAVTTALSLGGLYLAFDSKEIKDMDPADLAELQKHLKVIDEYGKNPEIVKGLPKDVQDRLAKLIKNLEKLKQIKAKAPAAAQTASVPGVSPEFGGT